MEIEKNIPIPNDRPHAGRKAKYPFAEMAIGESVFFPGESSNGYSAPYAAARMTATRKGMKFTARNVDGGLRIWRTE